MEPLERELGNIIQRQFEAEKPMEKCYTDITEFLSQQVTKNYDKTHAGIAIPDHCGE